MKWLVRCTAILIVIVLLAIGSIVFILATFDPNDYKDQIASTVRDSTGRELTISGDIGLSLYPILGFEVTSIHMGNPSGFAEQDFLDIKKAHAGVKIMPLIKKKIELTKIIITEPTIHIIKAANGNTNLAFNKTGIAKKPDKDSTRAMDLSVGNIEINNAHVTYKDKRTGNTLFIDPLNITIPRFDLGKESSTTVNMLLKTGDGNGQIKMDGTIKAIVSSELENINIKNIKTDMIYESKALATDVIINLTGQGTINTKSKTLNLNVPSLNIHWDNSSIKASSEITGTFSDLAMSFSASSQSINLDTLRKKSTQSSGSNKPLLPFGILNTLGLFGDLSIKQLISNGLTIENVYAKISSKKGILNIAPVSANFYKGKVDASVNINAHTKDPVFTIKNKIIGVEIGEVLKAKLGKDYVTGKATINYDLKGTGNSMRDLQKTSEGTFSFVFGEGYIKKWQLSKLLNQAVAFFESEQTEIENTDKKDNIYFTSLEGSFVGKKGVFHNDDLKMIGPATHALGSGTINIAKQVVDYKINVGLGEAADSSGKHIPIQIKGPISAPKYSLDTEALFMGKVKDKLLDSILGGSPADAGTTGPEGTITTTPSSDKDTAKKLIEGFFGGQ